MAEAYYCLLLEHAVDASDWLRSVPPLFAAAVSALLLFWAVLYFYPLSAGRAISLGLRERAVGKKASFVIRIIASHFALY